MLEPHDQFAESVKAKLICRAFCDYLLAQVKLLDPAYRTALSKEGPLAQAIAPLLYAVRDSSQSMEVLSGRGKLRDCYAVARTIIETIINICFILARGEELAKKALRHAHQKSHRDLERNSVIGMSGISVVWSGKETLTLSAELSGALEEFTTKRGKERTEWTEEKLQVRLQAIESRYGQSVMVPLHICFFAIYRHASEIVHGTVFGALFSVGLTEPGRPRSEAELMKHRVGSFNMLFILLGCGIEALLRVLVEERFSDESALKESKALRENLDVDSWIPPKQPGAA